MSKIFPGTSGKESLPVESWAAILGHQGGLDWDPASRKQSKEVLRGKPGQVHVARTLESNLTAT